MLDTVRIPRAVPISPDRLVLKAVLVRVRMLVVSSASEKRRVSTVEYGSIRGVLRADRI